MLNYCLYKKDYQVWLGTINFIFHIVCSSKVNESSYIIDLSHESCEIESCSGVMYSIQYYVREVCGFLRVLWFPLPIKLTATISLKYCGKLC